MKAPGKQKKLTVASRLERATSYMGFLSCQSRIHSTYESICEYQHCQAHIMITRFHHSTILVIGFFFGHCDADNGSCTNRTMHIDSTDIIIRGV